MQILNNFNIHVRFTNVRCTIYLDIFVMYDLDSSKTYTYPLKTADEGVRVPSVVSVNRR